jgi:circadian clock protein KaiC
MVDGLIELDDLVAGVRTERSLVVRKFRGSSFLRGRHSYRISDSGLQLFPRVEAQFATPSRNVDNDGRQSTGIEGLDEILGGGMPVYSTTGLVGPTGTGKTITALSFLSRSSKREPGLYYGFFETPQRLALKATNVGIDLPGLTKRGDVEVLWRPQGENMLDELAHELLCAIERRKVKRLAIDGMPGLLEAMIFPERFSKFMACLTNELRARNVTTFITMEAREISGMPMSLPVAGVSALMENLIFLRFVEQNSCFHRLISVEKVRDSDYDPTLRRYLITDRGVEIGSPFHDSEGLLTGSAHAVPATKQRRVKTGGKNKRRK